MRDKHLFSIRDLLFLIPFLWMYNIGAFPFMRYWNIKSICVFIWQMVATFFFFWFLLSLASAPK